MIVRDVTSELVTPYKIDLNSPMFEQQDNSTQMQQLDRQLPNSNTNERYSVNHNDINRDNNTTVINHQTKPIPVKENGIYNFTIKVEPPVADSKWSKKLGPTAFSGIQFSRKLCE